MHLIYIYNILIYEFNYNFLYLSFILHSLDFYTFTFQIYKPDMKSLITVLSQNRALLTLLVDDEGYGVYERTHLGQEIIQPKLGYSQPLSFWSEAGTES